MVFEIVGMRCRRRFGWRGGGVSTWCVCLERVCMYHLFSLVCELHLWLCFPRFDLGFFAAVDAAGIAFCSESYVAHAKEYGCRVQPPRTSAGL